MSVNTSRYGSIDVREGFPHMILDNDDVILRFPRELPPSIPDNYQSCVWNSDSFYLSSVSYHRRLHLLLQTLQKQQNTQLKTVIYQTAMFKDTHLFYKRACLFLISLKSGAYTLNTQMGRRNVLSSYHEIQT